MTVPMDRVADAKVRVEELRRHVRTLQDELANLPKPPAKGFERSMSDAFWEKRKTLRGAWIKACNELGEAKAELAKLSGTNGSDPKWALIAGAWRVLNRLDEAGVDIGEDGRALLDSIAFHVPLSKLEDV